MKYLGVDWDQMQQDGTKGEFANMKANLCDAGAGSRKRIQGIALPLY